MIPQRATQYLWKLQTEDAVITMFARFLKIESTSHSFGIINEFFTSKMAFSYFR